MIGIEARQGPRAEMEDRHVVAAEPEGLLVAVYDGHGGAAVADLAERHLPPAFFAALRRGQGVEAAFHQAFAEVDRLTRDEECGAGVTAVFVGDASLVAANLGDGRALVVGDHDQEALTRDHRVDDPEERRRVVLAGARIEEPYLVRGRSGLMLTRSLGDRWFRAVGVIATPEISIHVLRRGDRRLVVASDGLWDELESAEVAGLVRRASGAAVAASAVANAVAARGGRDNLTVIVVDLPARDHA